VEAMENVNSFDGVLRKALRCAKAVRFGEGAWKHCQFWSARVRLKAWYWEKSSQLRGRRALGGCDGSRHIKMVFDEVCGLRQRRELLCWQ
jgi:hypothetical protein